MEEFDSHWYKKFLHLRECHWKGMGVNWEGNLMDVALANDIIASHANEYNLINYIREVTNIIDQQPILFLRCDELFLPSVFEHARTCLCRRS